MTKANIQGLPTTVGVDRLVFYGTTDSKGSYQCLTKFIKFNIDLDIKESNSRSF